MALPSQLTPAQQRAAAHRGGPLVLIGAAGTGKTTALLARYAALVAGGAPAESVALLRPRAHGASALRRDVEDVLGERGYGTLAVCDPAELAARILRDEALELGSGAAALGLAEARVTPADRLGVLLDSLDELPLREHDLGGRPAVALAGVVARIDACKDQLVDAARHAEWAASLGDDDPRAEREREFAALFAAHERLLAQEGLVDSGELVARAVELLAARPHVRARAGARLRHVALDDAQDASPAALALVRLVAAAHGDLVLAGDDDQALQAGPPDPSAVLRAAAEDPDATVVRLDRVWRSDPAIARAAHAIVTPLPTRLDKPTDASAPGEAERSSDAALGASKERSVSFWECVSERAQAQAVAAEVEALVRAGTPPEAIAVLVGSMREDGPAISLALEERAVPHARLGGAALFGRAEVRDVLAWLRLLADPTDSAAVVRALARPPIELRSADIARCVQISKRRKLDAIAALAAATEAPQLPPEARERIARFLALHRGALQAFDTTRPDAFVPRLVDRLGLRRQQLFAAQADVVERLLALSQLSELAADHVRRSPQATARDFARYVRAIADAGLAEQDDAESATPGQVSVTSMRAARLLDADVVFVVGLQSARLDARERRPRDPVPDVTSAAPAPADAAPQADVAMRRLLHLAMSRARRRLILAHAAASDTGARQPPSPLVEEVRAAIGGHWERRVEQLFGPDEALHATYSAMRDELLSSVSQVSRRIGELRLDTDLDVTHGVARYLELVKLAALIERPAGQPVAEALTDVNARLIQAVSPAQRDVFESSTLDDFILGAERDQRARAQALAAREEPSLTPFLPRRGDGLMLSASDIETYRACPLRYKFARVLRIPSEPTLNQRFGIAMHQVLERFHAAEGAPPQLAGLLDQAWRRGGLGDSDQERQLRDKAQSALRLYSQRVTREHAEGGRVAFLERQFSFPLGPHVLRGRVDRVDQLPGGDFELIDYKTGRPRTQEQLREDVQLSLYAVGAREAWDIEAPRQAYLYVLDDEKVSVPAADIDPGWIEETVMEVGEGILGQGFEPTPSFTACSMCDFRIACPAAEQ